MKSIIKIFSKLLKKEDVSQKEDINVNQVKYDKQYRRFVNRMGKHRSWFDILSEDQKRMLFKDWEVFKNIHRHYIQNGSANSSSKPSFRKFIYLSKSKKSYFIPKTILREKLIDSLLN